MTSRVTVLALLFAIPVSLLPATGCQSTRSCVSDDVRGPGSFTCELPGWDDRTFFLHLPEAGGALPLILLLHGGGGRKEGADRTTCPDGDRDHPDCLVAQAVAAGFAVAVPDGTSSDFLGMRTWNAGGGKGDFRCTSGKACEDDVDDIKFFRDLIAEIGEAIDLDDTRVYSTGISNGGAMSHRLACQMPDRIAAIAAVGGANQAEVEPGCDPDRPVSVLQIHGTDDPCWRYEGGTPDCPTGQRDKAHVAVAGSLTGDDDQGGWVARNSCQEEAVVTELSDRDGDDGTTTQQHVWSGCLADTEVQLLRIEGGGHTWPRGWQYLGEGTIGKVAEDFDPNARILDFFGRFVLGAGAPARDGGVTDGG